MAPEDPPRVHRAPGPSLFGVTSFDIAGGHYPELRPHPTNVPRTRSTRRHTAPHIHLPPSQPLLAPQTPATNTTDDTEESVFRWDENKLIIGPPHSPRCSECHINHQLLGVRFGLEGEVSRVAAWKSQQLARLDENLLRRHVVAVLGQRIPQCVLEDFSEVIRQQIHAIAVCLRTRTFIPSPEEIPERKQTTASSSTLLGQQTDASGRDQGTESPEIPHRTETHEALRRTWSSEHGGGFEPKLDDAVKDKLERLLHALLDLNILPSLPSHGESQHEAPHVGRRTPAIKTWGRRGSVASVATQASTEDDTHRFAPVEKGVEEWSTRMEDEQETSKGRLEELLDEVQQRLQLIEAERARIAAIHKPTTRSQSRAAMELAAGGTERRVVRTRSFDTKRRKRALTEEAGRRDEANEEPDWVQIKKASGTSLQHNMRECSGIIPGYFRSLQRGTKTQSVNDVQEARSLARRNSWDKFARTAMQRQTET